MNGMEVIMKKKSMCRICLVENVRMHVVTNRNLQEVYKKLTDAPFVTEDIRPMLACSFCYTKLKQCWQLQRKCLEAEEVFAQMLNEDYEMKLVRNPSELEYFGGLIKSSTVHVCIFGADEDDDYEMTRSDVEVAPAICETQDDAELQELVLSDEMERNYLDDTLDLDNISAHQCESDLDLEQKYVPPLQFESDSEAGDKACAVERTPAVKKPERETQRHTLEDTITDMQETNRHLNVNMICTTNNNTHKSVSKYKEPITDTQQDVYNLGIHKIKACRVVINKLNIPLDSSENFNCKMWHNERDSSDTNRHQSEQKSDNSNKRDDINGNTNKTRKITIIANRFSNVRNKKCSKNINKDHLMPKVMTKNDVIRKSYSCQKCQLKFLIKDNLELHIRMNACESSYVCDVCQSSFIIRSNLDRHMRIHTGEKPYKCDVCQKSFSIRCNLERHVYTHTGYKPYTCNLCHCSFGSKSNLNRHMWKHTGEKPYMCDVCQKTFRRKQHLAEHTNAHTGKKPYKCDICQKCFTHHKTFKVHTWTHTGEKPYKCDVCQRSFKLKGYLICHIRRRHTKH